MTSARAELRRIKKKHKAELLIPYIDAERLDRLHGRRTTKGLWDLPSLIFPGIPDDLFRELRLIDIVPLVAHWEDIARLQDVLLEHCPCDHPMEVKRGARVYKYMARTIEATQKAIAFGNDWWKKNVV